MYRLKVRIINSRATDWYAAMRGQVFEVYRWGWDFILAEDYDRGADMPWRHIDNADAEVIK